MRLALLVWAPFAVAAAVAATVMMPLNENYYDFFVNYDPQGDPQQYQAAHVTALMRYTSGFFWGQLFALAYGAVLAWTVRPATGREMTRRLLLAVAGGAALAGVTAAVTVPLATARTSGGMTLGRPVSDDPMLWLVLVTGLVGFPLWASAGVGLAVLSSRRPAGPPVLALLVAVLLLPCALLTSERGQVDPDSGRAGEHALPAYVFFALVPPAASIAAAPQAGLGRDPQVASYLLVAGSAGYAALFCALGYRRIRRSRLVNGGSG